MKVFVYSAHSYDTRSFQDVAGSHKFLFTEKNLRADTVHLAEGCEGVVLFTSDDASKTVLQNLQLAGIKYVFLRSAGYDHVDLESASSLGIKVANVPEYSPYSIAEHATAMLMALNRKIVAGQQLMALQDFRLDDLKGFDIHGKTVGVIGTGKIGMAFIRIMKGFGADILAFDPRVNQEALDSGVRFVTLETLLRESDIVSLHCPLTNASRYLISATQLDWMKPGAILINTARGAIIKTMDLIEALKTGKLGGACLDVYEHEKGLFFDNYPGNMADEMFLRLRGFRNVLITGHQAFLTDDALNQIASTSVSNISCFEKGIPYENELRPHPAGA